MSTLTAPRQVRLLKCALRAPGLDQRGATPDDQRRLRDYGYDLMPYVQRINIFESIFEHTLSGSITLLENIGLVEHLPIVGVETLTIAFTVEDSAGESRTFAKSFRISKVHRGTYPRHDWRLYTMEFVTHEFVTSVSARICRAYSGVTAQSAVVDILKRDLGLDEARIISNEETDGKINVVIPNYSPLKAINYFTVLSQTKGSKESNFLFFETLDGFHFTSIRKLIESAPKVPRTYEVNPGAISGTALPLDSVERNSLIRVEQDETFDLLKDIASGTLRAQMVHFDLLARKIAHVEDSRYSETFKTTTHLDKYPLYPNNFERSVGKNVRLFTVPSNTWTANSAYVKTNDALADDQRLRESIVLRNRQLREIRHLQTVLDVPGAPDVRAGSVINVNYPSSRTLEGREDAALTAPVFTVGTPYYSGKHIVASVQHILATVDGAQMQYRMNIRACRDSLGGPLIGTTKTE